MTFDEALIRLRRGANFLSSIHSSIEFRRSKSAARRPTAEDSCHPEDLIHHFNRVEHGNGWAISGYIRLPWNGDDENWGLYQSQFNAAVRELEELGEALRVVGPAAGVFVTGVESAGDLEFWIIQLHHSTHANVRMLLATPQAEGHDPTSVIDDLSVESRTYMARIADEVERRIPSTLVPEHQQLEARQSASSKTVELSENDEPRLQLNHIKVLKCLRKLRARSNKTRKSREDIGRDIVEYGNAETVSKETAYLGRCGYVDTLKHRPSRGMPGGCFITQAGLERLRVEEQASKKRDRRKGG
jgi:hypothetical protein